MTAQTAFDFESQAKDEALDVMEVLRGEYLEKVRAEMRRRAETGAVVTPDDARAYFESLNPPAPEDLSRNFLACVFRGKEWEFRGTYKSRTPGSHGNRLNMYGRRGTRAA